MAGHYKRGTGLASIIAFGNFSGCAYLMSKLDLFETAEICIDSDRTINLSSGRRPALCSRLYVSLTFDSARSRLRRFCRHHRDNVHVSRDPLSLPRRGDLSASECAAGQTAIGDGESRNSIEC